MSDALSLADQAIDHELARVAESFRFILDITPTNVDSCRAAFLSGAEREPAFTYRELEDDPDVVGASLGAIDVDGVEDPAVAHLLHAKRQEVELQLDLLRVRDTEAFLPLSIDLYGDVDEVLLERAEAILAGVAVPAADTVVRVDAARFAELAELELDHYRSIDPDIGAHVQVRPDVTGVMVAGLDLMIGTETSVHPDRVQALLQHEIGTHLLTHVNGSYQPLRLLEAGLAGYEETQEGLAVLTEFLVGGLSAFRLRQLAGRVVAVDLILRDQPFAAVHERLVEHGFSPRTAFTTTMRVCRAGGLTKDAIYLRGLLNLLDHLGQGGSLEHLWLGKMSLDDLPLVDELVARGVVSGARMLPRCLGDPVTEQRVRDAARITDLVQLTKGLA